jgi:hypothetical protein
MRKNKPLTMNHNKKNPTTNFNLKTRHKNQNNAEIQDGGNKMVTNTFFGIDLAFK